MNLDKLTLKYEEVSYFNRELRIYLKNLKGIDNVVLYEDKNTIDISYDKSKIGIKTIFLEVNYFIGNRMYSWLSGFNKHSFKNLENYVLEVKDYCCEFCFYNNFEELFFTEGIDKLNSDFDYDTRDGRIEVYYDKEKISLEEIKSLIEKF